MKKIILSITLGVVSLGLFAQQGEFSRWSLGVKGGMDYYRVEPKGDRNYGWTAPSIFVEYSVTPLFGLGIDAGYFNFDRDAGNRGTLNGATIDALLYGSMSISNLVAPTRTGFWRHVNLYTTAGFGAAFYNHEVTSNIRDFFEDAKNDEVAGVAAFGAGLAFNLGHAWELALEGQYRYYTTPKLGGAKTYTYGNDAVVGTIGVRYKFGSKNRTHVRNAAPAEYFPMPATTQVTQTNINVDAETLRRLRVLEDESLRNKIRQLENELNNLSSRADGSTVRASFHNVEFEFDSFRLTNTGKSVLDEVARILKNNTSWSTLRVDGYTDNIGTADVNKKMSENRASEVKNYLVSKGIPASKITTRGHGQSNPIASNNTEEGRQQNRRVEFEIGK